MIGFLAGLLVGLGLALAVAVYVTKVPVPFVDRGVSRKPTQDAIEAEKNRNWNPNAGLAGSKPAAPKNDVPTPAPAPEEGAVKAEGAAPAPAAKPDTPAPAASSDPLGDFARSRTQTNAIGPAATQAPVVAAPAGGTAESDAFIYFVQAGAFRTPADAEAQRAKLAMLGFDAKITEREQAGQTVYRVRTGPYRSKTDADATQAKLTANSVDAALVRVQR